MKTDRIRSGMIFGAFLFGLLLLIMLLWWWIDKDDNTTQADEIMITESGFFSQDLLVTLKVPKGVKVYYTENCEEPSEKNGILYENPIVIPALEEESIHVFRFRVVYPDGRDSETHTRTYILGKNVENRFTTKVLSVVGEPEQLFGYKDGIFARGIKFDQWKEQNPDTFYGIVVDANFQWRGPEYERPVHIEYFDQKGRSLFALNGGVRVHGGFTRMKNQKSFRLYARKEYDDINEFSYPVVKLLKNQDGTIFDRYKRLLVRNSGNDNGFCFIRSELCCELANAAGFPDVCLSEPVCVYMNGMYQGVYWIGNSFDKGYFEEKYGTYSGDFVILEGGVSIKKDDDDPFVQTYVEECNALHDSFMDRDLRDDRVYAEFCDAFDVENYLKYCAIQIYVGNIDWPGNNVKVYRYVSPNNEYIQGTVFDGKYRYLMYDLDYGFGLLLIGAGADETNRTLNNNLYPDGLLYKLTLREDCRNYLINTLCDIMNTTMSADNVKATLARKHGERQQELYHMLERTDVMKDSLWYWENASLYYDTVETSYAQIIKYAENRRRHVLNDIIACYQIDAIEAYTLHVKKDGLSGFQVNQGTVEEVFEGVYFGNVPVILSPTLSANETFAHWLVNGETRKEETLTLTSEDIKEAVIQVELVTKPVEDAVLEIHAVKARGINDYVELINYSDRAVSTGGYYLTDTQDAYRYSLPSVVLRPGETIRFYGKDATTAEALGGWGLSFNLRQGETLRLHRGKKLIESLVIPQLTPQGVYMKNHITGTYLEEIPE